MKISVVIPCYNQAEFLPETLQSLIGQSYSNWEAIVVDDGSTDNAAEVIRSFTDERIIYVRQAHRGVSSARNKGLSLITGNYVKFLDADDMLHPLTFEGQLRGFKMHNADISISGYWAFKHPDLNKGTTSNTELTMENPLHDFIFRWEKGLCIPIHCFLYKKWVIDKVGEWDTSLSNREDWDFHIRTAILNPKCIHDPSKFALYRVHNKSCCRSTDMNAGLVIFLDKYINNISLTKEMRDFFIKDMVAINPEYTIPQIKTSPVHQHDLSNTTFVLCVKIDSPERLNNLDFCINFLQRHFITNIVVMEEDSESKILNRYNDILHIFTHKKDPVFHRTATINRAVINHVHTPYFCNLDIDIYTQPENYVEAVRLLSEVDIVYPYNGKFYDIPNKYSLDMSFTPDKVKEPMGLVNPNSYGGIIFFKKRVFVEGGMENERFISWSPEDNERYVRFHKLGYRIKRLDTPLYHFSHPRGQNSNESNPYYKRGVKEWNIVSPMSKEQLKRYIKRTFVWTKQKSR